MDRNSNMQILVVDDDPSVINSMEALFESDYRIISAETGQAALDMLNKYDVNLILLDLGLPDINGMDVLRKAKDINPTTEIVLITGNTTLEAGIEAMKAGAFDYVVKPFDVDRLAVTVRNALQKNILLSEIRYRRDIDPSKGKVLVGHSRAMKEIFSTIEKLASNDATILITGESGTGKDMVARAIHNSGHRKDGPFVPVNCGAIPSELVESELFGYEKGAFTGASNNKIGKFEIAQHGTIFLDEISTLPPTLQPKLLRVLQEKIIERVGGTRQIPIDARIIAATNIDLQEMVKQNGFREDLYYRLNIFPVNLPPLREHPEDIPLLVAHFLDYYNKEYHRQVKEIDPNLMNYFNSYEWKGNIRELENVIQRLLVVSSNRTRYISIEGLNKENSYQNIFSNYLPKNSLPLESAMAEFEREYIKEILLKAGGNRQKAAEILGVHRNTLLNRMKALALEEIVNDNGVQPAQNP